MLLMMLAFLGLYLYSFVVVAQMARRRNRDAVVWVILSFLVSPFTMMFILWLAGSRRFKNY